MTSFFLAGAAAQVNGSPVMRLNDVLDWSAIAARLVGLYRREQTNGGGPQPYDPLGMFKLMLLGQWHGLSDTQLEEALRVRLDFLVFCGFDLGVNLPDSTTICRFRNRLVSAALDASLLAEVNRQLEALGLKVNEARGAIIDASIISSAARPNRHVEVGKQGQAKVIDSADRQARWVKKGKHYFYGYRAYVAVDTEDGFIETSFTKPANESETRQFKRLVRRLPASVDGILADKGFASAENRHYLQRRRLTDLVQHNGHYRRPLQPWQKALNGLIGTVRYKVEQAFGTLKRQFHLGRARYFGVKRVQAQVHWAAIGFNLLKAQRKIERLRMQPAQA